MKLKHWVILALVLAGGLFLLHNYMQHGGINGVKTGLGLGSLGSSGH